MNSHLANQYAQLKAAADESADMDTISNLMVDILGSLHQQFMSTSGRQRDDYEWAYGLLDHTLAAHQATKQDISNPFYVSEVTTQVGRDIQRVLPRKKYSLQLN